MQNRMNNAALKVFAENEMSVQYVNRHFFLTNKAACKVCNFIL